MFCLQVIVAEGEHTASRALRAASAVVERSPAALQLRYLQTLSSIAAETPSTIIYPVTVDGGPGWGTSNTQPQTE